MSQPFVDPPLTDDFRAGALVLAGLGAGNASLAFDALQAIEPGEDSLIQVGPTVPLGAYQIGAEFVIVAISGTETLLHWALNVLGSLQTAAPPVPGKVSTYWATAAFQVAVAIGPAITAALPSRRLVLLGHSSGGAIVQILASLWSDLAGNGTTVYTYGAPRVGDPAFADAVGGVVHRVENTDDPIPSLPPETWAGLGSPWTWPGGLESATYQHAGSAQTLHDDGTLTDGGNGVTIEAAFSALQSQEAPTHEIQEYRRRLELAFQDTTPTVEFEDPPALDAVDKFLSLPEQNFFLGDQGMALCQGVLFFRTSEEAQGWGESWFADTNVPAMLTTLSTLLQPRAAFLAATCQIHAYRASIVDPSQPKRSRAVRLTPPVQGSQTFATADGSRQTNETMDAIDYQINSTAVAARKIASFRGIPDNWLSGSTLSDTGRQGLPVIDSFIDAVKQSNLGFRIYDRTTPPKSIDAIGQDVVSKLVLLTVTAHLLPDNSIVTLRKIKTNPMLNGKWRIKVVTPNTFLLVGSQRFFANSAGEGTVQPYSSITDTIADRFFNQVSTRKTGRPFGSRRGRRSARLLHH